MGPPILTDSDHMDLISLQSGIGGTLIHTILTAMTDPTLGINLVQYGAVGILAGILIWFLRAFLSQNKEGWTSLIGELRENQNTQKEIVHDIEASHASVVKDLVQRERELVDRLLDIQAPGKG